MTTPTSPTDTMQELSQALSAGQHGVAATLGLALAGRGALPLMELFGIAALLSAAGRNDEAIALYQLWLRQTPSPLAYAAHFNLAVLLSSVDDVDGAEEAYRTALALKPDFTEAQLNLGSLQERAKQPELALVTWRDALVRIDMARADQVALRVQALNNLGRLLEIRKRYPESEEMLTRSLDLNPQQPNVITHVVHLRQKQCKWPVYLPRAGITVREMIDATSALATLSASDDPATQLAAARRFVKEKVMSTDGIAPMASQDGYVHSRLRIGYLSSDLCSHAVSILTAELFELHDRERVEVYAFSWSNEDGSPLRARVVNAMDHYIRIGGLSDEQAATCIRSHEIDILIDLHGLTLGARPNILSYRPAPVQMTYLGFPGPTALPGVDYVLADEFVLPPELAPHFTEKPLYLPNCFQINDRRRAIGVRPTRAACGLPEDAFVFCSFNNNHKFTPEVFASWMRILHRAPDSVLWLLADSAEVQENLLAAAEAHGIGRARLVFAGRVMPVDYLARFQAADLFLDTLPFNAGTTASDALWAGLPLLTRAGRSFAGRMAGSLLKAVGLPELITYSEEEYENLAVRLAQAPAELAALRQRLADNRDNYPLFDSPRFVRDMEDALLTVARGTLRPDAEPQQRHAGPLVSILVPLAGPMTMLEQSLDSALAQTYDHVEIVICDSNADHRCEQRVAPYLAGHPRIRYARSPGLNVADNLRHCLALSRGNFVNVLDDGALLMPDKLMAMLQAYAANPDVAYVVSSQQPLDASGAVAGAAAPLLPNDAVVAGAALGEMMLTSQTNVFGSLSAALLRRSDAEAALAQFGSRHYQVLAPVATWLSLLAERGVVYFHAPYSAQRARPSGMPGDVAPITESVEWLQLFLEARKRKLFVPLDERYRTMLAQRLGIFVTYTAGNHLLLRATRYPVEEVQQVIRQAYQVLMDDGVDVIARVTAPPVAAPA